MAHAAGAIAHTDVKNRIALPQSRPNHNAAFCYEDMLFMAIGYEAYDKAGGV
jgi:hypothetical protein